MKQGHGHEAHGEDPLGIAKEGGHIIKPRLEFTLMPAMRQPLILYAFIRMCGTMTVERTHSLHYEKIEAQEVRRCPTAGDNIISTCVYAQRNGGCEGRALE